MDELKEYFSADNFKLYFDDSFRALKLFEPKSVDMIFADPPYFLSSGGVSCHSGKQVIVDKGERDKSLSISEKLEFNRKWIALCRNLLKDDGTIWIHNVSGNTVSFVSGNEEMKCDITVIDDKTITLTLPANPCSGDFYTRENNDWYDRYDFTHNVIYTLVKTARQ